MAVSLLRALALAALLFPPTDAAVRVLISGLPLMGHINPLASVAAELHRRKLDVTVATFELLAVSAQFKPTREVLPNGVKFISLGRLDKAFDPYADQETVAKVHRSMYSRLTAVGAGFDLWFLDVHALGAVAAAEDVKAALVFMSTTLPSEFLHAAHVFKLDRLIRKWPVIINTAAKFDTNQGDTKMYMENGAYPASFRFVGSVFNITDTVRSNPMDEELQQYLDKAKQAGMPVVYVSLGTVKKIDMRDVNSLMEALKDHHVVWSLPKEHQARLNQTVPAQFYLREWLPQAAILNHTGVKIFVSHCGMNSAHESLQLGVPLICIPQSGEQVAVAQQAQRLGVGSMHAPTHFDNIQLALQVQQRIKTILAEYEKVAVKVQVVGNMVRESGGAGYAADTIEETVRNKTKSVFAAIPNMAAPGQPNTAAF